MNARPLRLVVVLAVSIAITLTSTRTASSINDDGYRIWDRAGGDYIPWARKLVGVEGTKVQLKREKDGGVDTFELSEFAADEIRLIKLWQDPSKRKAVELGMDGGFVRVAEDGSIELSLNNGETTDDDLKLVARSLPEISSLLLTHSGITQEGLKSLAELKRLKKLHLPLFTGERATGVINIEIDLSGRKGAEVEDNRRVVDPGFRILAQIKSLEELEFEGNGSVSFGKYWDDLAKSNLKRLKLDNARLSAADLQRIAKIPTLEWLDPGIGFLSTGIKPPVLNHLRGMKQLRGLDLGHCRLTDEDAAHLSELPQLRELHCHGWTRKGFEALAKCEQLEILRVLDSFDETTDDTDLAQIGKLKNLKTLWISSSKITDEGLANLRGLVQLQELHLPESITPKGLRHLEPLKNLQKLGFTYIDEEKITVPVQFSHSLDLLVEKQGRDVPDALRVLGQDFTSRFRGYVSLNSWVPPLDLPAMQKYGRHFQKLEHFSVNEDRLDEWVAALAPLTNMRHFTIAGTRNDLKDIRKRVSVKRSQLEPVARWNKLEELVLDRCDFEKDALQAIAGLPRLSDLEMMNCGLTPGNLKGIGAIRSLKTFSITGSEIPPEELVQLGTLDNLEELTLSVVVAPKTLAELKGLKGLKKLEFRREGISFTEIVDVLEKDWGRSRREAAKMILKVDREDSEGNVHSLEFGSALYGPLFSGSALENGEFRIRDEELAILAEFPELETLELPAGVSDAAMPHVAKLKNLKSLKFRESFAGGGQISDEGTKDLTALQKLEFLDLGISELTAAGMKSLAKLKSLKELRMEKTRLTDDTLEPLATLKNLEDLRFDGRDVTAKGLDQLVKFPQLRRIDLGHMPRDQLEKIRQAYPKIGFNGLIPADRSL